MLLDICREETCRRLAHDQRGTHPPDTVPHGGQTVPVEIAVALRDDAVGRRAAIGGRTICTVTLVSGVWPSDTTLLDACAEDMAGPGSLAGGVHGGGTVSAHVDSDREVEVAFYLS